MVSSAFKARSSFPSFFVGWSNQITTQTIYANPVSGSSGIGDIWELCLCRFDNSQSPNIDRNILLGDKKNLQISDTSPPLIKLSDVRNIFLSTPLEYDDLGSLLDYYLSWVSETVYLAMQNKKTGEYYFVKGSKRGNSVYRWNVENRLKDAVSFLTDDFCSLYSTRRKGRKYVSNILFITLTCNPNYFFESRILAWESIQMLYNRFITAFRNRYGKTWVLKTVESTINGYPHLHLLVLCEYEFECFQHNDKWRVKEKGDVSDLWFAYVDIQTPKPKNSLKHIQSYLMKDILKQVYDSPNIKFSQSTLSLAMNWLFRKQSFSVSGKDVLDFFLARMSNNDLIKSMYNSNQVLFKVCIKSDFNFLGVVKIT
ncbi:MAG: hypothetical protein DRO04_03120, partial [Candidatus Iainarchaeum archaeon]